MKLKNIIKLTSLGASVCLFASCKDAATSDTADSAKPTTAKVTPANSDAPAGSLPVYIVTVSGTG